MVTIQLIPSGGRFQIGYLPVFAPSPPDTQVVSQFTGPMYIGPYLFNVDSGEVVEFIQRSFTIDHLIQGAPIGREKGLDHWDAQGTLRTYDGTCLVETVISNDLGDGTLVNLNGLQLHSYNVIEQCALDHLVVYAYKANLLSEGIEIPPILVNRVDLDSFNNQGDLISLCRHGGLTVLSTWWPDEVVNTSITHPYIASARATAPTIPLQVSDEGTVEVEWTWQTSCNGEETEYSALMESVPVFISPILTNPLNEVSYTTQAVEAVKSHLNVLFSALAGDVNPDGYFYAAQSAIEGIHTSTVNGIEFTKDLAELHRLVKPILDLLKKRNIIQLLKSIPNLILWWKYAIMNNFRDLRSLWAAFKIIVRSRKTLTLYAKYKNSTFSKYGAFSEPSDLIGFSHVNHSFHARVVARLEYPYGYDESPWGGLQAMMEDMGLRLTTRFVWDILTLSFVVDWFVNIGKLLDQVDYSQTVSTLRLRDFVSSVLTNATTEETEFIGTCGLYGSLSLRTYTRNVSLALPAAPFEAGPPAFLNHWWEGALIFLNKEYGRH